MDSTADTPPKELAQVEEQMRSVVNHVVDGIISIDERGTITTFNPAAERIFGYTASEVIGRNVNTLMPEPYHSQHDEYLSNYLTTGQAKIIGIGREVVGRRKDGSTFPMELAVSKFHIDARRYFTGIVRDITERQRLEHELRQRLVELADADRQKNEFLAILAHELRNPLAPMRNALHLMKMPGTDKAQIEGARDMMERQLHNLVRLVDDLLDVSRIVRGKIELRKDVLTLAMVITQAVETAQPLIDACGHELTIDVPDEAIWVEADLVRLAQVIANLLTNAAKYTDRAGRIRLIAAREGDRAVVRVRDSGIGIAPDRQACVFDLFEQGDQSMAHSQGGLGVGLTLVKRLVDLHDGSVAVHSDGLGHGSEFVIRLPAVAGTEATQEHSGRSAPTTRATGATQRRVLVVDDNIDAAESIAMILQIAGYEVRCVYDGPTVLQTVTAYRPDVVVLDIGLAGISGYDIARQIREEPDLKRTVLVAMTGYGQEEDRRRSREAGFDYHLTKPVDPEVLQSFVARLPSPR